MCCSVNVSVCFVCCVFVNCLVKQFAMCLGVVAILLLNVMDVFSALLCLIILMSLRSGSQVFAFIM